MVRGPRVWAFVEKLPALSQLHRCSLCYIFSPCIHIPCQGSYLHLNSARVHTRIKCNNTHMSVLHTHTHDMCPTVQNSTVTDLNGSEDFNLLEPCAQHVDGSTLQW